MSRGVGCYMTCIWMYALVLSLFLFCQDVCLTSNRGVATEGAREAWAPTSIWKPSKVQQFQFQTAGIFYWVYFLLKRKTFMDSLVPSNSNMSFVVCLKSLYLQIIHSPVPQARDFYFNFVKVVILQHFFISAGPNLR